MSKNFPQKSLFFLLRALYWVFTLFPVRRHTVIFISYPDATGNSLAMFEYLRDKNEGYTFVWLVENPSQATQDRLTGSRLRARRSVRGIFALATAGLVFHTHGIIRVARRRKRQVVVNLWHGMPLKTIGVLDASNPAPPFGDFTIATSPLLRDVLAKVFAMPPERVLITGLPRNDALFAGVEAKPTMALWMPTYRSSTEGIIRKDSSLSPERFRQLLDRIDVILEATGVKVTLKLHPMDILNQLLVPNYRAIDLIDGHDQRRSVEELLAASNCLVTDYSSVAIDYMVLNRPIGYYCPDRADYGRGFIPEVICPYFEAGVNLADEAALVDFFMCPPPPSEAGRAALVTHHDGMSSERLWQALRAKKGILLR